MATPCARGRACPAAAVTSRSMHMSRAVTPARAPPPRLSPGRAARRRATAAPPPRAGAGGGGAGAGDEKPAAAAAAVFDGVYGPWSMEPADLAEVWGYRASLAASALCGAGAAAEMLLFSSAPPSLSSLSSSSSLPPLPPPVPLDALLAGGALSLGAALVLIHVYVTPLKRFVQLLWLLGVGGAIAIHASSSPSAGAGAAAESAAAALSAAAAAAAAAASPSSAPLSVLEHVAAHPAWDVLLIGPLAAAATGVSVKEGFCFRRPEAAVLALALPALCLAHLLSAAWPPAAAVVPSLGAVAALAAVALALGKAFQDPKGDVGDKSVFEFRKLGAEEQEGVLARLRAADEAALRAEAAALAREREERGRGTERERAAAGGEGDETEGGGGGGGGSAR